MGSAEVVTAEGVVFPEVIIPPSSTKSLVLLGNGITDMTIETIHIKFTEIAFYAEPSIQSYLESYKGKLKHDTLENEAFFKHLLEGHVEKLVKVVFIKGIKGSQYGSSLESSIRDRLAYDDKYEEEEEMALEELVQYLQKLSLDTRTSILYRWPKPCSTLEVTFSSDDSIPKEAAYIVENAHVSQAILEWIVGARSISPSIVESIVGNIIS